jgi:hypothetical protein
MPINAAMTTTASVTSIVTIRRSSNWNSPQADSYQRSVRPLGSQLLNQRAAKLLSATIAIIAATLTRKNSVRTQTAAFQSRASGWVCIAATAQPLPPATGPR